MATVCICAYGSRRYARIAHEAVRSVLSHSDFDVCLVHDVPLGPGLGHHRRVRPLRLRRCEDLGREDVFNAKLEGLRASVAASGDEHFIMLDADAVLVRRICESDVRTALDGRGLAMVEQPRICGSEMGRPELFEHYRRISLPAVAPGLGAPSLGEFRYYNSGVVLFTRDRALEVADWVLDRVRHRPRPHEVEGYMIADQDHLQVYANSFEPGSCSQLPWYWNHCEHWDAGFPHDDAWIVHFSNFCEGPTRATRQRMRRARRRRSSRRAAPGDSPTPVR